MAWALTLSLTAPLGAQGAFPSGNTQVQLHTFPTDQDVNQRNLDDPDDPDARDRTEADDIEIARKKAARDNKNRPREMPDSVAAPYDGAPIVRNIEIVGAPSPDVTKAKRVLVTRTGEPLDPEKQRKDLENLHKLGLFRPNVLVEAEDVRSFGLSIKRVDNRR
jgi:hypothetical protein